MLAISSWFRWLELHRCVTWAETSIQKEMLPETFDPATGRSYGAVVQGWRSNHLGAGGGIACVDCNSRYDKFFVWSIFFWFTGVGCKMDGLKSSVLFRCSRVVHCAGIHRAEPSASTAQDADLFAHSGRVQRPGRQRIQHQRGQCARLGQPHGCRSGSSWSEDQSERRDFDAYFAAVGYKGSHHAEGFERAVQWGVVSAGPTIQCHFIRTSRSGSLRWLLTVFDIHHLHLCRYREDYHLHVHGLLFGVELPHHWHGLFPLWRFRSSHPLIHSNSKPLIDSLDLWVGLQQIASRMSYVRNTERFLKFRLCPGVISRRPLWQIFNRLNALERTVILFDEIEEFCLDRENPNLAMESRMLTTAMLTQVGGFAVSRVEKFSPHPYPYPYPYP